MMNSVAQQHERQDAETSGDLARKAERCRRLAAGISDREAAEVLRAMASQYENGSSEMSR